MTHKILLKISLLVLILLQSHVVDAKQNEKEFCSQQYSVNHPCFRKKILEGQIKTLKRDISETNAIIEIAGGYLEVLKAASHNDLKEKNISSKKYDEALKSTREVFIENKLLLSQIKNRLNEVLADLHNINNKLQVALKSK